MTRTVKVAAAQVGSVHVDSDRHDTLQRIIGLLRDAASQGAQLVVYPETTFTTFFPRHVLHDRAELDKYFEAGPDITQSKNVAELFLEARKLGVDVCVGYAERTPEGAGYNTCVYYSATEQQVVSKYRKIHLPGNAEPFEDPTALNQLEKKYFTPGDLGFTAFRAPGLVAGALKRGTAEKETVVVGKGDPVLGMMICNDRRWPESWRAYGLQGAELILCGYNTPDWSPGLFGTHDLDVEASGKEALFHHRLAMQYNSYANSCFSISAARSGQDDGKYGLIGGSSIVGPDGHIIAEIEGRGEGVVVAEIDLEKCRPGRETMFNFDRHRRTETYGIISAQTGVIEPDLLQ